MLSAAEIASMRATVDEALPDTCTIRRKAVVSDGGGGQTTTWSDLAAGVACGIAPVAGGEGATTAGRVVDETTHVVTLPDGQDVTEADRIVVDGVTYELTLVRKRGAWELNRRAEVRAAP